MVSSSLPSGVVTFLFTDIEGSTALLRELGSVDYGAALAEHRRVIRAAIIKHRGVEMGTEGDAFFVAFSDAVDAVAAAQDAQRALGEGPVRVRMGLHTGSPLLGAEGYVGEDVHLGARVAGAGHGGQVLISSATRECVAVQVSDLGEHRLKDFPEPVSIFQLGCERFPPLKTISNTNLPRPASSFIGREREMRELAALVSERARFVTLAGAGGSGKTRLAIETAAELVAEFKAGVFWVELAPLRDASLVPETVARTLGAKSELSEHIGERELLLVLDNFEQVSPAAPWLASLVERCRNLRVLVTSRELLRVRGEEQFRVGSLSERDAIELFCARADVDPIDGVRDLCRALDDLPLALELAAARARVLSPAQMLERLSQRLDLLKGGRDADARQQTLRATIDWSYQLLTSEEKQLYAALSIFAGGCTLEAAEAVAQAELDTLQSLVEKSLLQQSHERFWMLETIRQFARERLQEFGGAGVVQRRHALHLLEFARYEGAMLRAGEPEEGPVAALEREIDNLRAAAQFGLDSGDVQLAREITAALPMYWTIRGRLGEARTWLERALALSDVEDETRRQLLLGLALVAYNQGDVRAAISSSDEAAALATRLGGIGDQFDVLRGRAMAALARGDLPTAKQLFEDALRIASAVDNGVGMSSCRLNLAHLANKTHLPQRAEELLAQNLSFVRARGQARCEAYTLAGLAETCIYRDSPTDAAAYALQAAHRAAAVEDPPLVAFCLDQIAVAKAASGDIERAAALLGATEAARELMAAAPDEQELAIRQRATARLGQGPHVDQAWAAGRNLTLDKALALVTPEASRPEPDA